ncbi:MAG: TerB family tellurite resistance protein [Rhodothermales bacterium]|nr:TerB family tellurite resistance protein [Rhodothermales bacterium]
MNLANGPSDWSAMHDVALLYLALSHGTDLELDPNEQETMAKKLAAQFPEAQQTRMRQVFDEVLLTYLGGHSREMVEASIASLKNSLGKPERIALLNDLAELASADGSIVPGEVAFIQQLAQFWEVDTAAN